MEASAKNAVHINSRGINTLQTSRNIPARCAQIYWVNTPPVFAVPTDIRLTTTANLQPYKREQGAGAATQKSAHAKIEPKSFVPF